MSSKKAQNNAKVNHDHLKSNKVKMSNFVKVPIRCKISGFCILSHKVGLLKVHFSFSEINVAWLTTGACT